MKTIRNLAAVSVLALALAACGSPAEQADDQADDQALSDQTESLTNDTAAVEGEAAASESDASEAQSAAAAEPEPAATPTAAPAAAATSAAPATAPATATAPAAAGPTKVAAAAPRPPIFAVCAACHSVTPGDHGIGPSLAASFGARAGHAAGFEYSDAMNNSGLVWNEANLDRYLRDPRGTVPGTTMAYAGMRNDDQRKAVIEYIKGL